MRRQVKWQPTFQKTTSQHAALSRLVTTPAKALRLVEALKVVRTIRLVSMHTSEH